jgi:hypothetical protein
MADQTLSHAAQVAAKWWADKLRGPAKMDAGSGSGGRRDRSLEMAEVMATVLHATEDRSADDADRFEQALAIYVQAGLDRGDYGVTLSTDYGPDYELLEVADSCGVQLGMASLPWKTAMWVKPTSVRVSEGYGAEAVEIL